MILEIASVAEFTLSEILPDIGIKSGDSLRMTSEGLRITQGEGLARAERRSC